MSDGHGPFPPEPSLPRDQRHFRIAEQSAPPVGETHGLTPEALPTEPEYGFDTAARSQGARPPQLRRRARRRWPVLLLAVTLFLAGGFFLYTWFLWSGVETIATDGSLSRSGEGYTNYLIVGTDSRSGLTRDLASASSIGLGVPGERTDTMVVLHIGDNGNHMVSLPRDLWVRLDSGAANKLNAARPLGGVPSLIRTVRADPGIPIQHYMEVDIAGFLSVIDAVGSISIQFDRPACDPKSGLDIRSSGPVSLGSEDALAYVRSRTYTEFDSGRTVGLSCAQLIEAGLGTRVGNSDFGRTERQRNFLLAVFDRVANTRNPLTVLRVLNGLTDGLRVDDTMGMFDAIGLLRELRGLNALTHALPVSDFSAPDGTSALTLNSESAPILDLFRTGGSG